MKEIQARWRAFNTDVDDAADDWDAFEQDGDTNKNRLFKAPLAVHKRLPGVVTPIDTDDVVFEFTHFDDVDDELIDDVNGWAQWFTSDSDAADDWAGQLTGRSGSRTTSTLLTTGLGSSSRRCSMTLTLTTGGMRFATGQPIENRRIRQPRRKRSRTSISTRRNWREISSSSVNAGLSGTRSRRWTAKTSLVN